MQCGNCGHELTTGASFCGNCGAPIAQFQPQQPPAFGAPPVPGPPGPHAHPQPPAAPTSPINHPPLPPHLQNSPAGPPPAAPVPQQPYPGVQPVQIHPSSKYNEMSIIAAVLLVFFPPVSLILGIIALNQIKKTHEQGRGLAITSIVIGGIVIALFVLMLVILASIPPEELD